MMMQERGFRKKGGNLRREERGVTVKKKKKKHTDKKDLPQASGPDRRISGIPIRHVLVGAPRKVGAE